MPDVTILAPFLVIGESVLDIVTRPDGEAEAHAGGSPANVAFGLGRLGSAAMLLTALGDAHHGDLFRAHLRGAGVQVLSPGAGEPTGTAVGTLDDAGAAEYTVPSVRPRMRMWPPIHATVAACTSPGSDSPHSRAPATWTGRSST